MASMNYNICNTDSIYSESGYSYSLPQAVLDSYLQGKAFDHPKEYSDEELANLKEDINGLFHKIMNSKPAKGAEAVISAGSPGSGKTTLMRQLLVSQEGNKFAYVCPDDVCLKEQLKTYVNDVAAGNQSFEARKAAYTKWRPGSNAATHLLLANLINEKFSFLFGTTSSSPFTFKFYEHLREQGYKIKVVHVSAPDDIRWKSIKERDKEFVQTTEEDVKEKGDMVPQRIHDTFLKYADEIEFYYRSEVTGDAKLAVRWTQTGSVKEPKGTLQVLNNEVYNDVKKIHDAVINRLGKPELKWEAAVESISTFI